MTEYKVLLLDNDGCETAIDLIDGLPAAKKRASYLLSDTLAAAVDSTHETLGTKKLEIRNAAGECLWDAFL
jgi:hypothetical protein